MYASTADFRAPFDPVPFAGMGAEPDPRDAILATQKSSVQYAGGGMVLGFVVGAMVGGFAGFLIGRWVK